MRGLIAAFATATLALAGCTSSHHAATTTSPPSAYVPADGQDAAITASHITGCTGVQSESIGGGAQSGLKSAASCTLEGHLVIVDSSAPGSTIEAGLVSKGTQLYYATGLGGWIAFLGEPGQTASTTTLQMQLTNNASGLLDRALNHDTVTPAPLDAQQQLAGTVAKDLAGTVEHVTGTGN